MRSKFILSIVSILQLLFLGTNNNRDAVDLTPTPIKLKYDFSEVSPYHYVITKKGSIYVEDDGVVFKFDHSGNLLRKILPPPGESNYVRSISVNHDEDVIFFYLVKKPGKLLGYDFNAKKTLYTSFFDGGGDIKCDKNGDKYLPYQDGSDINNPAINKIRVFKYSGKNFDYPTNIDIEGNFEIVNDNIMFLSYEKKLFLLPIDLKHSNEIKQINLTNISSSGNFLGLLNDHYVFSDYDDKIKKDVIRLYDLQFHYVKSFILNFTRKDVVVGNKESGDAGDLFSDLPAGNVYYYDNNNHIYFLRFTRKGTLIYNLDDFIK